MSRPGPLLLAGGGHSHALLLRRWSMRPEQRPKGLITLINRSSTALYSGMVPGLIAGQYSRDAVAIDLRQLCDRAGVALVIAEITGLDTNRCQLLLKDRPPLHYRRLSLNVGAESRPSDHPGIPIKPLEPALQALADQDASDGASVRVIGGGPAGQEVVLALRRRWPRRPLELVSQSLSGDPAGLARMKRAGIAVLAQPSATTMATLLCTGSQAPTWLRHAGLPVDGHGRIQTSATLEVCGHRDLFASGDCGVIRADPRPPSGVWAVRSATTLARNLLAADQGRALQPWRPQRQALQLMGDPTTEPAQAWGRWGPLSLPTSRTLWWIKQRIDQAFMAGFRPSPSMRETMAAMACRGCAAKLPASPLLAALEQAGLSGSAEDAALVSEAPTRLQSVDGFPALVSDPWLNARLTTLHACSDLWACGARADHAMAVVTLPAVAAELQQELLAQTLSGIRSVLQDQGAALLGGHTLEARSPTPDPASLGLQVALSVTGTTATTPWPKRGLQAGDALLLSRPLGTGVLFAAAMSGHADPADVDRAIKTMNRSQHRLVDDLQRRGGIHACTDITGFGLLGHLGEMLTPDVRVQLALEQLPAYRGALRLLDEGHASSLAPANRQAWELLDVGPERPRAAIELNSSPSRGQLELLVDPQTCGPLLISCPEATADALVSQGPWQRIGSAESAHG